MNFSESLQLLIQRIEELSPSIQTEESTKTSFVLPFFQMLGYDVFDPREFVPEFTADYGIKKGEKVDYAIIKDGAPIILIECKSCTDDLSTHTGQLFRYFGTTEAKFGILTNGIIYKFYTDLDHPNKLDEKPFLQVNLLDLKKIQIPELMKFTKDSFNVEQIMSTASELKYTNLIQNYFDSLIANPSEDFIRLLIAPCYDGVKTQNVIATFEPIVRRSINQYINDAINARITSALHDETKDTADKGNADEKDSVDSDAEDDDSRIETTPEEMEAYYIVRAILCEKVNPSRIGYKDTISYFNVLLDNNIRKWLCRIKFTRSGIQVRVNTPDKPKIKLDSLVNFYDNKAILWQALDDLLAGRSIS